MRRRREETDKKPRRRRVLRWAALVAAVLVLVSGSYYAGLSRSPAGLSEGSQKGLRLYVQALNLVQNNYVDQKALNPKKQSRAAIQGMLGSLGDKGHTRFLTPGEVKRSQESLSGKYVGVGIRIEDRGGKAVVSSSIGGSPAAKAGVQSGDVVVAVNGENVESMDLSAISGKIRGKEGTKVDLKFRRDGSERTFNLTRSEINVSAASWNMIPDTRIAHVRLSSFSSQSAEELKKTIGEARKAGAERFVLDLRDNPGGQLDQAVQASSLFLKPDSIVYIRQDSDGSRKKVRTSGNSSKNALVKPPITVLVNGGTASSAEILAGALRDDGRARLIGTTTFGTGTVLQPYKLNDGSELLIGIAEWLTPNGDFIRKNGIAPGVKVDLGKGNQPLYPKDESGMSKQEILSRDAQLRRAVELVRG